jgi:hypothetical protein
VIESERECKMKGRAGKTKIVTERWREKKRERERKKESERERERREGGRGRE